MLATSTWQCFACMTPFGSDVHTGGCWGHSLERTRQLGQAVAGCKSGGGLLQCSALSAFLVPVSCVLSSFLSYMPVIPELVREHPAVHFSPPSSQSSVWRLQHFSVDFRLSLCCLLCPPGDHTPLFLCRQEVLQCNGQS